MARAPDFYIDNQAGAPFRAELNGIIAALVSLNAGTSEPPSPQAGMHWLDTSSTPWTLYRRNHNNTAWVKQYDASNRPGKADVGLGNVPNYPATSSITDGSGSRLATAAATKKLNDRKLEKTATAADSSKLGGVAASSYALQSGDYSGLRARATTKADVGLGSVPNYSISSSTGNNSATTFASSKAVYDLNQAKLGKSSQAADSAKLGGKAPSSYASTVHSHGAGDLPTGTTGQKGVVQLSDSTASTSTTLAATANSVRKAKSEAIASGVPPGFIGMFAGTEAQIPSGWQLCNGQGQTSNGIQVPNLLNRMVICAGGKYSAGNTGGAISATTSSNGSHSHNITVNLDGNHSHSITVNGHTLPISQIPAHDHGYTHAGHGYGNGPAGNFARGETVGPLNWFRTGKAGSSGSHSHSADSNRTGSHSHSASASSSGNHTHTVSTMPPYYALAFIIKL